jgi:hypothetical protein
VIIACGVEAARDTPTFAGRSVANGQCRARALLTGGSLAQRKWNHANGHKQQQVKSASKKMRFNIWINLFFHVLVNLSGVTTFLVFTPLQKKKIRSVSKKMQNLSRTTDCADTADSGDEE